MKTFKPAFGLSNRHLQTLYSSFFRNEPQLKFDIETFELEDGDFVECYWYDKPKDGSLKPIVTVFHGLEGSYNSPYIKGIMKALIKAGYSCVLMHFRACSGKINRKAKSYHSGDTSDAKAWVLSLSMRFPHNDLFSIGYSIGGNVLLKLLGEWGDNSPLKATISVSAPLDLANSADTINKGISLIYQHHLLKLLKSSLVSKYKFHDMKALIGVDEEYIMNIKTIRDFDEVYTAKINNFLDADDYYKKSSSKQYLKDIKTNTLIIHSVDDPFMTKEIVPTKDEISSFIELEIYEKGGHLGFISGSIFNPKFWLEARIILYFNSFRN